jgi:ribose 5-phosphate isomerase A
MDNDPKGAAKRRAAEVALSFVQDGQVLGLGTGSTARYAIEGLAKMIQGGLTVRGVATSTGTAQLAKSLGIPLIDLNEALGIDLTIDGADEVDPRFDMIKGGGGALTREKLVAIASSRRVMVVDETKLVSALGETRPLPVEVLPFCWMMTARRLEELGCEPKLRRAAGRPFLTDNGNYILDCTFPPIQRPAKLETSIKLLPGVVESGLFVKLADTLVIGFDDRAEVRERPA